MNEEATRRPGIPTVYKKLKEGGLVELVYNQVAESTGFAVYRNGRVGLENEIELPDGTRLVPISPTNNLIRHQALLLPEWAEPYGSIESLQESIVGYLSKYVDLGEEFQRIAAYYALLTWVHDAFNELPYLRFRGDYGSGKTRALTSLGSICYRPFFASGASTVSPIFHTLDSFGGTLILDEADFRFTDEKSELVKIFNNGNVKGFPVLRTAITAKREFDPRAFNVFGPKVVAMRQSFEDQALESRFLTEEMGQRKLRADIPINLPDSQRGEATALRNKLLMFRFENLERMRIDESLHDPSLSPRQNQILAPLLALTDDHQVRAEIRNTVRSFETAIFNERASSMEAGVLEVVLEIFSDPSRSSVTITEIVAEFRKRYSEDYERPITNRQIGGIVRRKLRVVTYKSHGVYVVPATEKPKLLQIAVRYGIDVGEVTSPPSG